MTTMQDQGSSNEPTRLLCPEDMTGRPSTLTLALRDLRSVNGRDPVTGKGMGNQSWVALTMAMIVIDTLAGNSEQSVNDQGKRFRGLLTDHGVDQPDAEIAYAVRCSLLHGYGIPHPNGKWTQGRKVILTPGTFGAYAIDTDRRGEARLSVPVFCSWLTERIANEAPTDWDSSLVDVTITLESLSSRSRPVVASGLSPIPFALSDAVASATGHALLANESPGATGSMFDAPTSRRPAPRTGPPATPHRHREKPGR